MNVQHVESLNDVVARITRIRVRETVPDSVVDSRRRCRAGRSHAGRPDRAAGRGQGLCPRAGAARAEALLLARQPDGAARAGAAAHRRARRRPDAELHARACDHRPVGRRRARAGVRRSRARDSANTVRAAKRTARRLDAELIALYVETDAIRCWARPSSAARRGAAARRAARRRGGARARPLGRRGDPGFRPRAQRHPRGGRQVAPLALVRAAPWLGGRRAGAQRLGPGGRGGAVRRQTRARRRGSIGCFGAPRPIGPYLEGVLTTAAGDGGRRGDRRLYRPAQHLAGLRRAGDGGGGAAWAWCRRSGSRPSRC